MKRTFIQAGGTIDKEYASTDDHHGYNFSIGEPAVKSILATVDPTFKFEIISVVKKDSLDMTDEDRQEIYEACQEVNNDKIIITHGTDRFKQTAEKLSSIKDKTIILTGAMRPEKFNDSDAMFNVGVAIGALNYLDNGIYIAIRGEIYPWNEFR